MKRGLIGVAAVLFAVVVLVLSGLPSTQAMFSDQSTVTAGPTGAPTAAFGSGSITPPVVPAATQGTSQSGTTTVTVTWSTTPVGTNGATATSYDLVRYDAATGGNQTIVCAATTALSCVDTPPFGPVWYAVRARFGTNWVKEGDRKQFAITDSTPPTLTVTTPVISSCTGTQAACGTVADTGGGTVASVEFTLLRRRTAFLSSPAFTCWDGSKYVSADRSACTTFYPATVTGTTWVVSGSSLTYPSPPFLGSQSFTLTVRATDSSGNVTTLAPVSFNN